MDRSVERLDLSTRLVSDGAYHLDTHFSKPSTFRPEHYGGRVASDGAHPHGLNIKRRVARPRQLDGSRFTRFTNHHLQDRWQKLCASFPGCFFGSIT